jgi:hypothetical protein
MTKRRLLLLSDSLNNVTKELCNFSLTGEGSFQDIEYGLSGGLVLSKQSLQSHIEGFSLCRGWGQLLLLLLLLLLLPLELLLLQLLLLLVLLLFLLLPLALLPGATGRGSLLYGL